MRSRRGLPAFLALLPFAVTAGELSAQAVQFTHDYPNPPQTTAVLPNVPPLNDLPDPYTSIDNWVALPDGREWGSTAGVDIDPDGEHLWAIDRCGANSCAGSDLDPILKIDQEGAVVESFGGGLIIFPHGIHVDDEGNVWVTDGQGPNPENPATAGMGHVVLKFSPDGDLLLTLGEPGVAGDGTDGRLNAPCDIVVGPDGFIYVSDGHSGGGADASPETVARIVVYDSNGNYVRQFGRFGSAAGELRVPHAVDIDAHGRLVVGDRGNNRLQIFELDGTYIMEMRQFGRPSGIYITDDNTIYVADSESQFENSNNPGWMTGIRVGNLDTGIAEFYIRGEVPAYAVSSNPEGVAVDADGNVYGAVVSGGGAMIKSSR